MTLYTKPTEPSFEEPPQTGNYREAAQEASPPWLLGQNGARYIYCQAVQLDAMTDRLMWGVEQRFPQRCQPGALPHLGNDKRIFRGLVESDENYARRLKKFKRTWKFAGNAPTLLRQLWELLRPDPVRIRYVANGYTDDPADSSNQFADWWTCEGDSNGDPVLSFERVSPSNWNWDGSFGYNVRFWVIIYRDDLVPAKWGVPPYTWGEDGLWWGSQPGGSRDWLVDAYNLIDTFKASGSHMGPYPGYGGGLIVADPNNTSAPWGPAGPFDPSYAPGYPMPDGTFASISNRPPGAVYLSGL